MKKKKSKLWDSINLICGVGNTVNGLIMLHSGNNYGLINFVLGTINLLAYVYFSED